MSGGRPRQFDIDEALDRALEVFWQRGYDGTTIPDLTTAMGINRPSLYAAFGNKESLFHKALDRYAESRAAHVREALNAPTARAATEQFLLGAIDLITDPKNPRGCLIVQAALACGDSSDCVRQELISRRGQSLEEIRKRYEKAKLDGDLPKNTDCASLARFIATLLHGMAVEAASGATRKDLQQVAEIAMRAWPA